MTKAFIKWASVKGKCPTCGCEGVSITNNPRRKRVCWAWKCRTYFTIPGTFKKH
jgi:hypothetical protein